MHFHDKHLLKSNKKVASVKVNSNVGTDAELMTNASSMDDILQTCMHQIIHKAKFSSTTEWTNTSLVLPLMQD